MSKLASIDPGTDKRHVRWTGRASSRLVDVGRPRSADKRHRAKNGASQTRGTREPQAQLKGLSRVPAAPVSDLMAADEG